MPRFAKGSREAKEYMAKIRAMSGRGGNPINSRESREIHGHARNIRKSIGDVRGEGKLAERANLSGIADGLARAEYIAGRTPEIRLRASRTATKEWDRGRRSIEADEAYHAKLRGENPHGEPRGLSDMICPCGECGIDPASWECRDEASPEEIRRAEEAYRKYQESKRARGGRPSNPPMLILGNPGRGKNPWRSWGLTDADMAHLSRWIDHTFPTRDQEAATDLMLAFLRDHPEVVKEGRSWSEVYRLAERGRRTNPPVLPSQIAQSSGFKLALAMYRKMHGHDPVHIVRVKLEPGQPKYMVAYGKAPQALYDATSRSTKGKRFHKFGEGGGKQPWLVTAPGRPKFLAFVGGSFKARDWIYD